MRMRDGRMMRPMTEEKTIEKLLELMDDLQKMLWRMGKAAKTLAEVAAEMKAVASKVDDTTTIPITMDDGHVYCDACGCEIGKGDTECGNCHREIDWTK